MPSMWAWLACSALTLTVREEKGGKVVLCIDFAGRGKLERVSVALWKQLFWTEFISRGQVSPKLSMAMGATPRSVAGFARASSSFTGGSWISAMDPWLAALQVVLSPVVRSVPSSRGRRRCAVETKPLIAFLFFL